MRIMKVNRSFCRMWDCGLWDMGIREKGLSGKDGCLASTFKETTKYEKGKRCNLENVEIKWAF